MDLTSFRIDGDYPVSAQALARLTTRHDEQIQKLEAELAAKADEATNLQEAQ